MSDKRISELVQLNTIASDDQLVVVDVDTNATKRVTAQTVSEYRQKVSINAQTGTTYTLALADAGKLVTLDNGSAITLTVPANSSVPFEVGATIAIAQVGTGTVTVSGASGVTVASLASKTDLAGQYASASLVKTDTDDWLLIGGLA